MISLDILTKIFIPLIAACIGAALAFGYQHTLEKRRDKRHILQVLMMYRNVGANELDWIKALNVIDLVFHKDKKVKELYHKFNNYTKPGMFETMQYVDVFYQLLEAMAQCSGYKSLQGTDIRDYYAPEALLLHYPNKNVAPEPSNAAAVSSSPTIPNKETD